MPPKRRGRNMRGTESVSPVKKKEDELEEEGEEGELHWLTFQNGVGIDFLIGVGGCPIRFTG